MSYYFSKTFVEVAAVDPVASMQAIENPELGENSGTGKTAEGD